MRACSGSDVPTRAPTRSYITTGLAYETLLPYSLAKRTQIVERVFQDAKVRMATKKAADRSRVVVEAL